MTGRLPAIRNREPRTIRYASTELFDSEESCTAVLTFAKCVRSFPLPLTRHFSHFLSARSPGAVWWCSFSIFLWSPSSPPLRFKRVQWKQQRRQPVTQDVTSEPLQPMLFVPPARAPLLAVFGCIGTDLCK